MFACSSLHVFILKKNCGPYSLKPTRQFSSFVTNLTLSCGSDIKQNGTFNKLMSCLNTIKQISFDFDSNQQANFPVFLFAKNFTLSCGNYMKLNGTVNKLTELLVTFSCVN